MKFIQRKRTNTRVNNEQKSVDSAYTPDAEIRFAPKMRKLDFKLNYFRAIFTFSDKYISRERFENEGRQCDGGSRSGCDGDSDGDSTEDVLFVFNFLLVHLMRIT